jgi:hypothetical protein
LIAGIIKYFFQIALEGFKTLSEVRKVKNIFSENDEKHLWMN